MGDVSIHIGVDDASLSDAVIYKPRIMRLLHDVLKQVYPDADVRVESATGPDGGGIVVSDAALHDPVRILEERVFSGDYGDWREPPLKFGIAENGTWAGTALFNGTHVDCPVVLGGDPAITDQVCTEIESRVAAGDTSGIVRLGGFSWEFDLVAED